MSKDTKDKVQSKKRSYCISHTCTECEKDLYPEAWKSALFAAMIVATPLLVVFAISYFFPEEQDPPYCYREENISQGLTKRIFEECPTNH